MEIYPETTRGPLEVAGARVVQANSFDLGNLVTVTASGWELADSTDVEKGAQGVVTFASPTVFFVATVPGTIVDWPEHDLGSIPDKLFLVTSGTVDPIDPSIADPNQLSQLCFIVLDADTLLLFPQNPKPVK